ncbi:hypothetical protein pEaSNUABM40_00007 [Erwinia phage pEa_SNUABM_40]|uniref:Uncharacterized protein n=1 Tax=Erwinia phage pEa_SNUABM_3 TaxID=2869552 RepID=A0AAE7XHB1_9CAUD|nr:hypothetical protein MPK68_gp007 [Erwinia phage pEa_SNUABM_3]QZE56543.1 hypothetical protein pEaSNUABM20_00007 [Erwinia phage pEa_SNUABM_20]QZE58223.1 hypothetical protein pEaSNUABM40_00007 [Erwinia phage pEa_SNUABM_40]UAW52789.1 hypothetical protein pEaSNUABM23_00007 [Erwinia phage pEa_SNUABM_23]UIW10685.1 hypothetical protein pEaSNUABM23_00007 [Erwinia phage pEa_SNUABM_31]QZE56204.1 hypothetical protein pEaSNUABM3_00007 [Erwinia phage pEa_SNUABM_3]
MYSMATCAIDGEETVVVYRHPIFTDYGLGLKINRGGDMPLVECSIVTGSIDGVSKLEPVTDHTAPLEVQAWCFAGMLSLRDMRESVNMQSLSLDALFPNNGGIVYYQTQTQQNQESAS